MKKWLAVSASVFALSIPLAFSSAPKIDSAISDLNKQIAQLLQPLQGDSSKAKLVFSKIVTDEVRAQSVKMKASVWRMGQVNEATISIPTLSYEYGDGTAPTTHGKIKLKMDVLKSIPQEIINQLGASVEDLVMEEAKSFTAQYGDAATVTAKVTRRKTDEKGNLQAIHLILTMKVDLAKLPAEKPKDEVLFTDVRVKAAITLQGLAGEFTFVSNPAYKGFAEDQTGLKETLEKLLAQDASTLQDVSQDVGMMDTLVKFLVSTDLSKPRQ